MQTKLYNHMLVLTRAVDAADRKQNDTLTNHVCEILAVAARSVDRMTNTVTGYLRDMLDAADAVLDERELRGEDVREQREQIGAAVVGMEVEHV